jgi:hypothetical protein
MQHNHDNTPVWEVDLYITGSIAVENMRSFRQVKGNAEFDPFLSDVSISRQPGGVKLTVTARASSRELAEKAALVFVGHMLDVLAFTLDEPLSHDLYGVRPFRSLDSRSRRVVEEDQWRRAFQEARELSEQLPAYLRALGWYRKGLYSDDPFDKCLAFWNTIEIVAGNYYPKPNGQRLKSAKEQIRATFDEVWSTADQGPSDIDRVEWVSKMYQSRNGIAHGGKAIDIHEIELVDGKVSSVRRVAYTFLRDWKELHLPGSSLRLQSQLFGA